MKKILSLVFIMIMGLVLVSCTKATTTTVHVHSYDTVLSEVAAQCGLDGFKYVQCSCGDKKKETIPALEHEYVLKEQIVPTCTTGGYDIYECKYCKITETRNKVDALGHELADPTDGRYFIFANVCSRCGSRCGLPVEDIGTYDSVFVYNFNDSDKDGYTKDAIDQSLLEVKTTLSNAAKYNAETDGYVKDSALYQENKAFEDKYNLFYDYLEYVTEQYQYAYVFYCVHESDETYENAYNDVSDYRTDMIKDFYSLYRLIYETKFREYFFAYDEGWTDEDIQKALILSDSYGNDEYAEKNKVADQILIDYRAIDDPTEADEVCDLYEDFVKVNNEIAALAGYTNYADYAYENVYDRAYSKEDVAEMRELVKEYLGNNMLIGTYQALSTYKGKLTDDEKKLYSSISASIFTDHEAANMLEAYFKTLNSEEYEKDIDFYEEADKLFMNGNYYFGEHKGAFSYYISNVDATILYFNKSSYSSIFTFIHEFGHYYENCYNKGLNLTMDLDETQSQGDEMLFLAFLNEYFKDHPNLYKVIVLDQLFSTLSTITHACSIDEFECICYTGEYTGTNTVIQEIVADGKVTADEYDDLYTAICDPYGLNKLYYPTYWRYVVIEAPMYYISYAMSAIPSVQIYAVAMDEGYAKGVETYLNLFTFTDDEANCTIDGEGDKVVNLNYEETLEYIGLSSPFEEETYVQLKNIFNETKK